MKKVQFGCGQCRIPGWDNFDIDVDITKPLPFESNTVDFIVCEMAIEHIYHREAWNFLEECFRILKPNGVARITIPDFVHTWNYMNDAWMSVNKGVTNCDGSRKDHMKSVLFAHDHKAAWTSPLLVVMMEAIGFIAKPKELNRSEYPELQNIEQHWRSVGIEVSKVESQSVEGVKP